MIEFNLWLPNPVSKNPLQQGGVAASFYAYTHGGNFGHINLSISRPHYQGLLETNTIVENSYKKIQPNSYVVDQIKIGNQVTHSYWPGQQLAYSTVFKGLFRDHGVTPFFSSHKRDMKNEDNYKKKGLHIEHHVALEISKTGVVQRKVSKDALQQQVDAEKNAFVLEEDRCVELLFAEQRKLSAEVAQLKKSQVENIAWFKSKNLVSAKKDEIDRIKLQNLISNLLNEKRLIQKELTELENAAEAEKLALTNFLSLEFELLQEKTLYFNLQSKLNTDDNSINQIEIDAKIAIQELKIAVLEEQITSGKKNHLDKLSQLKTKEAMALDKLNATNIDLQDHESALENLLTIETLNSEIAKIKKETSLAITKLNEKLQLFNAQQLIKDERNITKGKHPDLTLKDIPTDPTLPFYVDENAMISEMESLQKASDHINYCLFRENCSRSAKRVVLAGISAEMKQKIIKTSLELKTQADAHLIYRKNYDRFGPIEVIDEKFFKLGGSIDTVISVRDWLMKLKTVLAHLNQFHKDNEKLCRIHGSLFTSQESTPEPKRWMKFSS